MSKEALQELKAKMDDLEAEAMRAYIRTYERPPSGSSEALFVSRGILSMRAMIMMYIQKDEYDED